MTETASWDDLTDESIAPGTIEISVRHGQGYELSDDVRAAIHALCAAVDAAGSADEVAGYHFVQPNCGCCCVSSGRIVGTMPALEGGLGFRPRSNPETSYRA